MRTVFDHVPGVIYRCEIEAPWRMFEVSGGVTAITGRPAADFVDCVVHWADVIAPEDLAPLLEPVENRALPGREFHLEYRIAHVDGSVRWVHDSGRVVLDAGGRPCLAGVILDVTAARESEAALRETAQQLRFVFDRSPVGAALVAPDARFVKVNDAFQRFVGYTEGELRRMSFAELTHPDHLAQDLEQVQRLARGEIERYEEDKRYVRKDGVVVWGRVSVGLVCHDDGRPRYFLPIIQDITKRKRAEEALRDSEERYRAVFCTTPDSVNINRMSDGLYLDVNDGFLQGTGWTYDELVGKKTSTEIGIWADPADRQRLVGALKRDGYCQNLEAVFRRKDGSTLVGLMSAGFMTYRGEPCILSVTRDITEFRRGEEERHNLEHQLQQAQKLESLGVLAGGIAHDFNNILMAVLGHAELALEELSPMSAARGSVGEIVTAARRAGDLCRQMLAYSGRASFAVERVNLPELVQEMLHLLKTSISKKALLNVQIEQGLPAIKADPSQIRQIVMNLVLNASEAIGDRSGVIALSAGAARCDREWLRAAEPGGSLQEGLYVQLEVSDTGCGMAPDVRARIFEPFFTTKFSGRGLGLAALLGIVRAHHGAIRVHSEVGKGSRFTLVFPALEDVDDASAGPPEAAQPVWRGSGTVLFADDEESLRALGSRMLERLGYRVITACDGREAVEIYRARQAEIDLVILDLTMPHLDGGQAFGKLRAIDPNVRVVLASGYSPEDVASRIGGDALVGVLQKPYTLSRMRDLLSALPS
jgi:two-component system, cell cycle sensor histidine kinase and response regulator CckA